MDQSPLIQKANSGSAATPVTPTDDTQTTTPVANPVTEPQQSLASTLPSDQPAMAAVEAVPQTGKPNVLVVDDEADAAVLFAELLNTTGKYNVQSAADGLECLEKCEKTKFDLVLLDIVMPKLDGVETLRQMKADSGKYGNPKVVMLTNIGGDIAIEKALELGAVGFKLKIDTEPEELLKTVEDVLNGVDIKNSTQNMM